MASILLLAASLEAEFENVMELEGREQSKVMPWLKQPSDGCIIEVNPWTRISPGRSGGFIGLPSKDSLTPKAP